MKLIGLSCVMMGLLLTGCKKPVAQETPDTPLMVDNTSALPPVATPAPTPQYAPPGVFYLLAPVRKETKDGIIRLLPGTEVKLVRNGKYLTPDGEMALDSKILTNDLTQARAARSADLAGQTTASKSALAASPLAQPPRTRTAAADPSSESPKPAPDSEANTRAIKFRPTTLKREEAKLAANVTYLEEKAYHLPRTKGSPVGISGSTSLTDWSSITVKLAEVRAEIQILEGKLQSADN